ncbi:MAG: biosynthetic-type acetolactate synthase large subunit [Duncaniella sp.]|nr:biosynthetic-type acetolactate synthase large subunit [Duncaniella sp.]HBI58731.1 biosynthetic-type acetolactate synthase large subunit [Porphyromonadaceae bacterium]
MSELISGAEAMLRCFLAEGTDTIFGYPGGAIMPFYDKLYDYTDRLRHILVRHEQGAIHAAQGYARASGRTGVVSVTSGPGATNVITGLSDALMDSTPIVVITGQVGVATLGTDAFQETDVVGIVQSISKWAFQIRRAEEIPAAVAKAFYIASTGRPGPVVLDVTKDAQLGMMEWTGYKPVKYIRSYNPDPEINPADLADAAALLNSAERPLILAGHGITIARAEQQLTALAEKADIPVGATMLGLSAMPSDHPLYKGMLGMHGNIGPNYNTNKADVILAVGMRFDDRVTGDTSRYAPDAKIIHIDIDASELNKNIRATTTIHGDAGKVLNALLPLINQAGREEWLKSFDEPDKVEYETVVKREVFPQETVGAMRMGEVTRRISEATGNEAICVTDVGQNQMMGARYFKFTKPRSLITSGGLGTMGFCLPAAIGAKLACPGRKVIALMGDGGFQMTMQELGTIMENGIGVKIVIMNNNFLGNVRQWQELFFNSRFSATPMLNPDFVAIAAAYGIDGESVVSRDELDGAIDRMLATDRPYLLNVNIESTDMVFPMVAPGAAIDDIMLNVSTKYKPETHE